VADQGMQVFDEGRRVVRPDIVQFLAQAAQTAQLVKMRKLEESKIPTGTDSVAFTVTTLPVVYKPGFLWISFVLVNDGPDSLYLAVNDQKELFKNTPLNITESYTYTGVYPIVERLYLQSVTTTAAIRIQAKRGEWR